MDTERIGIFSLNQYLELRTRGVPMRMAVDQSFRWRSDGREHKEPLEQNTVRAVLQVPNGMGTVAYLRTFSEK